MTTQLIESTSSAPTLAERAIGEWQRTVERHDREHAESRRREFDRKVDVLRIHLRDTLGLADSESIQLTVSENAPNGFTVTTADGLRFALDTYSRFRDSRDREQLHVAVPCARCCGKDLWVYVPSLEALGGILQPDATNVHDYPCLQEFDDDGEPTTDTLGNPLKPRAPYVPQPSAYERAKLAADAVEQAAERLAAAMRQVQELEDERPNVKSACIAEMIGTPDLLKPSGVHSASSAEKVVESHARYAAHRQLQARAEVEKHRAHGAYEAAKLRGQLAVELFIAEERNR